MSQDKIFFIGCGHMGSALLDSWLENESLNAKEIVIVEKNKDVLKKYKKYGVTCVEDIKKAGQVKAKLIVFAVKPAMLKEVMAHCKPIADKSTIVMSVAAGKTVKFIEGIYPQNPVIRMMPNMAVKTGLGVSALFAGTKAKKAHKDFCFNLMKHTGIAFWVKKEDDLHTVTAVAGSSPAYIYNSALSLAKAAQSLGIKKQAAHDIAVNVLLGSVLLYANGGGTLEEAVLRIATPGGTTEAAVKEFNKNNAMENLFKKAMAACIKRSKELSK